ncbi:MAG: RDD family protein [Bdellovibrionales bacterium]|nr:RDD family protein [Bdellovibrionales bacterium]
MDLFDDFEMKPITEGLGFHKKAVRLNDKVLESKALKDEINSVLPKAPPEGLSAEASLTAKSDKEILNDLLAALDPIASDIERTKNSTTSASTSLKMSTTLPRTNSSSVSDKPFSPSPSLSAVEKAFSYEVPAIDMPLIQEEPVAPKPPATSKKKPTAGIVSQTQRGASNAPKPRLTECPISLSSIFLDAIIVFALTLIFLVSLLLVTEVDLLKVLGNSQGDLTTQISLGILYIAVLQMYVVVSRSFFGKTLAEWTFDLQMGSDIQQRKALYPVKVVWRSILVVLTGVVLLPILSFVTRKDILSYFTGLQLYRRHD